MSESVSNEKEYCFAIHREPQFGLVVQYKATHYTLARWSKLLRFLEYPELELSKHMAENSIRPMVLGRKNWIHLGSQQAGPKVAAILSVVGSCRRLKIPIRDYLAEVLPGLADRPLAADQISQTRCLGF